jgi:hypothetical protein
MFDFQEVTHVIVNPKGTYSLVGSVPIAMLASRTPTTADIMGGRVMNGRAYVGRCYQTIDEIRQVAAQVGARLCDSPTCACRSVF